MAMLDLVEDSGQLSAQPFVQPDAEDFTDPVGRQTPEADLTAALEDLVNGKVALEDEVARVFNLRQGVEAGQVHLAAFFLGELRPRRKVLNGADGNPTCSSTTRA